LTDLEKIFKDFKTVLTLGYFLKIFEEMLRIHPLRSVIRSKGDENNYIKSSITRGAKP